MSTITETLKQKLDELDLDRRLNEFVDQAEQSFQTALSQAGGYVHERRADIDRLLDTATEKINTQTQGQYSDHVVKVRGHIAAGVDKLAAKRAGAEGPGSPYDDPAEPTA
ncbi:MAG: hypothetical protein EOO74_04865 [Myxococcales bacterium]|nr:MAG: hypothetical protein EOO74_04865 [Myxococcales bacterium]